MFTKSGKLKYSKKIKKIVIFKKDLKEGTNCLVDHIVIKKSQSYKIYDRICDHAGGKIVSRNNSHTCPLHNWKFIPEKGLYENGIRKKEINFLEKKDILQLNEITSVPQIKIINKDISVKIKLFNHAFLKIETKDFSFITDPWAFGPAFNNGWFLKKKTRHDWIEEANNADFLFISHNHPDHLHPLSLSKIRKNIPVLVPNFQSKSTENFILSLGFKEILKANFNNQYHIKNKNFYFSLFKSGNFKDDSGIYFSIGNFTCLLDVDAQNINFDKLPKAEVYGSSFGGGARGYPWMFENITVQDQIRINDRAQNIYLRKKMLNIKKIEPKYFLPYASFFDEKLKRDIRIKRLNVKFDLKSYKEKTKNMKVEILDTEKNNEFTFIGKNLVSSQNINKKYFSDIKPKDYLDYSKKHYNKIDKDFIKSYFLNSNFNENFKLFVFVTDDNFKFEHYNFFVNFNEKKITFNDNLNDIDDLKNSILKKSDLVLKIRKDAFLYTLFNKMPWEDLQIGFQCLIQSDPEYNFNFWYHFTNKYIRNKYIRDTENCSSCERLNFYVDESLSNLN